MRLLPKKSVQAFSSLAWMPTLEPAAPLVGSPSDKKYDTLLAGGLNLLNPFLPIGNKLQLARSDDAGVIDYEQGWPLPTIAPVNSVGIVTARDALCIQFTQNKVWKTVQDFAQRDSEDARSVYGLGEDARDWQVALAQRDVNASGPNKKLLHTILYRPFDTRQTYYTGQTRGFLCMPRPEVMRHMLSGDNRALSLVRSTEIVGRYEHIFVTNLLTTHHTVSIKEVNYHFPLWLYDGSARTHNFAPSFLAVIQTVIGLPAKDKAATL